MAKLFCETKTYDLCFDGNGGFSSADLQSGLANMMAKTYFLAVKAQISS